MSQIKIKLILGLEEELIFPSKIIKKDPLSELIFDFDETNVILKSDKSKLMKLLYFNRKKINDILYDEEEAIQIDNNMINDEISNYFYLIALIEYNKETVNYEYDFDCIKKIFDNKLKKANNNNKFNNIILSKIIIGLLSNYEGTESKDEIKNSVVPFFNNNLKDIKDIDLDLNENNLNEKKIEEIYSNINIFFILLCSSSS